MTDEKKEGLAALARLTPEQLKNGMAAIAASQDPNHKFARVAARAVAYAHSPEFQTAITAQRILAAGAEARNEAPPSMTNVAPPQQRIVATAEQIIAAGKKRRGEA